MNDPVPTTSTSVVATSVPKDAVLDTPVGVTIALPTAVIDPLDDVSALPHGNAVLPIATET